MPWRIVVTMFMTSFLGVVSASFTYGLYLLHRGPSAVATLVPAVATPLPEDPQREVLRAGRRYLDTGEVEQAILTYRHLLAEGPSLEAQLGLAEGESRAGRQDVAAREYERALRLDSTSVPALRALVALYARHRETWALADQRAQRLLEIDPADAEAQLTRARLLVWRGKGAAAAEIFSHPAVQPRMTIEDRRNQGFALARAGHAAEAEKALAAVAREKPDDAVLLPLAGLLSRRGDWKDAVPLYRTLVRHRPGDVDLLLEYGTGLVALRQCAEALGPLAQVVSARPDRFEGTIAHARALRDCGRSEEAGREFARAAKRRPDDAHLHREYGDFFLEQKKPGKAVDEYRRAQSLGLRDRGLTVSLADALDAKGKHREARDLRAQLEAGG